MRPIFIALSSLLTYNAAAFACSCGTRTSCPNFEDSPGPIFIATIISVTDAPDAQSPFLSRKARVHVDEAFTGVPPGVEQVDVLTPSDGASCGLPFAAGETYLLFESLTKNGSAFVSMCSGSVPVTGAQTAIQVLRLLRDGKQVPAITGQIAQQDLNFDGPNGSYVTKPLVDSLVRVKREDGKVLETRSDSHGVYAFYGLPPGQYQLAPELPPGKNPGPFKDSDFAITQVEVLQGSCQYRDIPVFRGGSIQGRILDPAGHSLDWAPVYIIPADQDSAANQRARFIPHVNDDGSFRFSPIAAGRYLIVVNPDDALDPGFPYRRTFYPGVRDRAAAAAVTVAEGQEIANIDIQLDQAFASRHLSLRVVWEDGRVVQDWVTLDVHATGNSRAKAVTNQPHHPKSIIDLEIFPDEPYLVKGRLTCQYEKDDTVVSGNTLETSELEIRPEDNQNEIVLTFPAKRCPDMPEATLLTGKETQ